MGQNGLRQPFQAKSSGNLLQSAILMRHCNCRSRILISDELPGARSPGAAIRGYPCRDVQLLFILGVDRN
jgi:hypothetical protein